MQESKESEALLKHMYEILQISRKPFIETNNIHIFIFSLTPPNYIYF